MIPSKPIAASDGEERVPVDLALADIHVLVDRHLGAGRVADVAQARRRLVVVGVGDVDMRDQRPASRIIFPMSSPK